MSGQHQFCVGVAATILKYKSVCIHGNLEKQSNLQVEISSRISFVLFQYTSLPRIFLQPVDMHYITVLLLLLPFSLAVPTPQSGDVECGRHDYTEDEIFAAANAACNYVQEGTTAGGSRSVLTAFSPKLPLTPNFQVSRTLQ
jgi:hypothetical protein